MNPKTIGHHKVGELKDQTRKANKLKGKNIAEKPTSTIDYKVKKGDTLYTIAGKDMKKVQKLKDLNNLKSNVIHPGQTLKVPA
jgi:LysM repeat protein